jgi:hypothetical protein
MQLVPLRLPAWAFAHTVPVFQYYTVMLPLAVLRRVLLLAVLCRVLLVVCLLLSACCLSLLLHCAANAVLYCSSRRVVPQEQNSYCRSCVPVSYGVAQLATGRVATFCICGPACPAGKFTAARQHLFVVLFSSPVLLVTLRCVCGIVLGCKPCFCSCLYYLFPVAYILWVVTPLARCPSVLCRVVAEAVVRTRACAAHH